MSKDKIEVNMNVYDIPILVEALEEANKEIERLNNIINELEDYICVIEYDERHSDSWQIPVRIHNKLKELKGGNKE